MEDALRKLDSHLNRIADVDYATRRCSLQGLVKILKEPAVIASKLAHNQTTVERLLIALLDRLADPMEKCRDLSLLLIEKIVYDCQSVHLAQNARNILLASCARFGDDPFPEPVEELRLRLIEICNAVLLRLAQDQASKSSALIVDELLPALTHALTDSLSEAKRAAGTALRQVCKIAPWQVPPHILVVTKHLTSNLAHQHAKTRVAMLEALIDVLCASSASEALSKNLIEVVLPAFSAISRDRSATATLQCKTFDGMNYVFRFELPLRVYWEPYLLVMAFA